MSISQLHTLRMGYKPELPKTLTGSVKNISLSLGEKTTAVGNVAQLKSLFAHTFGNPIARVKKGVNKNANVSRRVAVILSGGPAAGGHNVIAGIFDALKALNESSHLIGFLNGPSGLIENKKIVITKEIIDAYRNTGGFDIIGSGRTKIETSEQFTLALKNAKANKIDALVIIGGDDSNTNAALLAEYFIAQKSAIQVIGVPKTIDGDLKNEYIETSFGFDTAVKTYSELIGNIARDAASARKYWHFIRLMGRSASHITLECALQTKPNVTLISEEVEKKQQSLSDIVQYIADAVVLRSKKKENFGVVLVPEGLIEFIPEMRTLLASLNEILAKDTHKNFEAKMKAVEKSLSPALRKTFLLLPIAIRMQLLLERDAHGNVQVSLIETERLLIEMVQKELARRKKAGKFSGSFTAQNHFFGYEARCAFPSNFDATYCYALGYTACVLIANGLTGYMSSVSKLTESAKNWNVGGIPFTMMMNIERRHGVDKPVIRKALVPLNGNAFKTFVKYRKKWLSTTSFCYPGAIQYFGPAQLSHAPTITLRLDKNIKDSLPL